jgi:hypothetical protein
VFSKRSASLYVPTRSGISENNKHIRYGVKLKCHKRDTCQQAVNTTSLVEIPKVLWHANVATAQTRTLWAVWADVSQLSSEQYGLICVNDLFAYFNKHMNSTLQLHFHTKEVLIDMFLYSAILRVSGAKSPLRHAPSCHAQGWLCLYPIRCSHKATDLYSWRTLSKFHRWFLYGQNLCLILVPTENFRGLGSSVGIATGYRLDGPGIESRWGCEIFRTCPDRPWGPPSLLYNGYRVFHGGKERAVRDADPSPPSSAVGMKE